MFLVYITCRNAKEAKNISTSLLKKRLIACANIAQKIESLYWWKGKIVSVKESLLLCKTTKKFIRVIKKEVKKIHSYSIPCIEFIEISDQNKEYLKWVQKELG